MRPFQWNASAGQTGLGPGALRAIANPLTAPIYYPEYLAAELEANRLLQVLFGTQSEVLVLTGNATLGIEASLLSLFEPGDAIITVNGGVFGQVMTEMAHILGLTPIEIRVPYGEPMPLEYLERSLRDHPQARAAAVVHVETSTGVEFPIADIAALVRSYDRMLIVDTVSSLGATEIRMDQWGLDVCVGSGQKALNAPQGLTMVAVGPQGWEAVRSRSSPIPSVCLDLSVWHRHRETEVKGLDLAYAAGRLTEEERGKIIHGPSPSASLVYALVGALSDILDEGIERVFLRHRLAARAVREGVRALNLRVLAAEEVASPVVTTILLPQGVDEFGLRAEMVRKRGIALGGGPSELGLHCTRIGSMGRAAHPDVQLPVLEALGEELRLAGHGCDPAAGVQAAEQIFAGYQAEGLWRDERANAFA